MSRIRNEGSDEINERQNARRNAEEEIRRLTEKVQSLQAEVYSRQTEKSRVEFNESQAGFRKNDVSVAPINSAYIWHLKYCVHGHYRYKKESLELALRRRNKRKSLAEQAGFCLQ